MKFRLLHTGALLGSGCLVMAFIASAHDTNTTHPQMTDAAVVAIKTQDDAAGDFAGAYSELYFAASNNSRLYWGDPQTLTEDRARSMEGDSLVDFARTPLNTVDGSVMEDAPFTRVFSHFYHAYLGIPLTPADSIQVGAASALEGFRYFDQAVEVSDDQDSGSDAQGADGTTSTVESGRSLGYWLLGHSLHHVEDMSSIAHVNNDAHVPAVPATTWELASMDAFEAQYVPTLLWAARGGGLYSQIGTTLRNNMRSVVPIHVRSLNDVWGVPRPEQTMVLDADKSLFGDSLTRATYNLSVFQGLLATPPWFPDDALNFPECPQGELSEMMNGGTPGVCGFDSVLHHSGTNYWSITGVGNWYYMSGLFANAWWAVSPDYQSKQSYVGPRVLPEQDTLVNGQRRSGSYFYIEDLARNQHRGSDLISADLFAPWGMRESFSMPWNRASNPVKPNPTHIPITEFISARILPRGTAYVAGVSKLWYQIANPPPYVRHVIVRQDDEPLYDSAWRNITGVRNITLVNKRLPSSAGDLSLDETRSFVYVKRRALDIGVSKFINPHESFTIEIEFSEPIQQPNAEKFGIYLGGVLLSTSAYAVTDMRPNEQQAWMKFRRWLITVNNPPATLNGRVKLGIRAFDRNYHFDPEGEPVFGAVVDGNPGTPAHRQRVRAGQKRVPFLSDRSLWLNYPWHNATSRDVNYPEADVPVGGFAYEQVAGRDESYYLLFDSTPASAEVSVSYKEVN